MHYEIMACRTAEPTCLVRMQEQIHIPAIIHSTRFSLGLAGANELTMLTKKAAAVYSSVCNLNANLYATYIKM